MKDIAKHSPWRRKLWHREICAVCDEQGVIIATVYEQSWIKAENIAEEIIRDHNTHNKLVEALDGAAQTLEACLAEADDPKAKDFSVEDIVMAAQACRAALAEANT